MYTYQKTVDLKVGLVSCRLLHFGPGATLPNTQNIYLYQMFYVLFYKDLQASEPKPTIALDR